MRLESSWVMEPEIVVPVRWQNGEAVQAAVCAARGIATTYTHCAGHEHDLAAGGIHGHGNLALIPAALVRFWLALTIISATGSNASQTPPASSPRASKISFGVSCQCWTFHRSDHSHGCTSRKKRVPLVVGIVV